MNDVPLYNSINFRVNPMLQTKRSRTDLFIIFTGSIEGLYDLIAVMH